MPIARYKDLCIDASDAHALASFWGGLLGWEAHPHDDGDACLRLDEETVLAWVNQVPEPTSVKNRIHLDVRAECVDAVVRAGASVVDEQHRWTVLRDPDGQEFCVFVRDAPVTERPYELVWDVTGDVAAAHRLAQWWATALGGDAAREDQWSSIEGIEGLPFECIVFQPVPEAKTTKNRVHLDVTSDALEPLLAAGAVTLRDRGEDGIGWTVMADPAGNEFCVFTPE